jgi:hypothetical protein
LASSSAASDSDRSAAGALADRRPRLAVCRAGLFDEAFAFAAAFLGPPGDGPVVGLGAASSSGKEPSSDPAGAAVFGPAPTRDRPRPPRLRRRRRGAPATPASPSSPEPPWPSSSAPLGSSEEGAPASVPASLLLPALAALPEPAPPDRRRRRGGPGAPAVPVTGSCAEASAGAWACGAVARPPRETAPDRPRPRPLDRLRRGRGAPGWVGSPLSDRACSLPSASGRGRASFVSSLNAGPPQRTARRACRAYGGGGSCIPGIGIMHGVDRLAPGSVPSATARSTLPASGRTGTPSPLPS